MSEKTAEHSPLPWTIEGPDDFGDYNIHQPDIRLAVGAIVSNLRPGAETAANAALIVRAVNQHAKLVEALEEFRKPENWRVNGRFDPESSNFDAYSFVDSALASLKEQS